MAENKIDGNPIRPDSGAAEEPQKAEARRWTIAVDGRKAVRNALWGQVALSELEELMEGLDPKNHSDFALALLEAEAKSDLIYLIDRLKGLGAEVAMAMVEMDMGTELAEHLDRFSVLNSEIAMQLAYGRHSLEVLRNMAKFPGLGEGQVIEWIMEVGDFEEIAGLFELKPDLDRMGVVQNLIEGDHPETAAKLIYLLDPEDQLAAIDDLGSQWEGPDAIDALIDLYPDLDGVGVARLAKKLGSWFEVADLMEANPKIDRLSVALAMVDGGSIQKAIEISDLLDVNGVRSLAKKLAESGHVEEAAQLAGLE